MDWEETEAAYEDAYASPEEREAWRRQWPAHCRACGGWGGKVFYENHGIPGPAETLLEPCDSCYAGDPCRCGRCSFPMALEDAESGVPCKACGWNADDGVPV